MDNLKEIALPKGKIPPQAVDREVYILGACLQFPKAFDNVIEVFTEAEVFYKPAHVLIFKAMKQLNASNNPIDLQTVPEQLIINGDLDKAGGAFYLIELTQKVSDSASIDFSCRVLMQKYMKRKMISIANEMISLSYDEKVDVFDLLERTTSGVDGISSMIEKGHSSLSWADAMAEIPKRVEFITNNKGKLTGLTTGLTALDNHFSGWQEEDFIVIGADSGMGKTALVLNFMLAAAKSGKAVGMFSMEMSVIQLAIRGVANESNYHLNQLMRNGFEHDHYFQGLLNVTNELSKLPIYIDDKPALTVLEMKRKARSMKRKNDIKMLVIDFVQMFSGDKDIRLNISEAARACKNLAKELKIPVIALSQLSREVRKARYCVPGKHHLKESSAIEEAADVIGLLYRPSYYGHSRDNTPDLYDELGLQGEENACLLVSKNRNGALGNVGLNFIENKTKFVNALEYDVSTDNDDMPF